MPVCLMETAIPAIVTTVLRETPELFPSVTIALPLPVPPFETDAHAAVLAAVQVHPPCVDMAIEREPPAALPVCEGCWTE